MPLSPGASSKRLCDYAPGAPRKQWFPNVFLAATTGSTERLRVIVAFSSQSWSCRAGAYEIPTIAPSGDCSLATV